MADDDILSWYKDRSLKEQLADPAIQPSPPMPTLDRLPYNGPELREYNPDPLHQAYKGAAEGIAGFAKAPTDIAQSGIEGVLNTYYGHPSAAAANVLELAAMGVGPKIKAYHVSPHKFEHFDSSKLLTGEGANAYMPGMYFAENPAVSGKGGQYDKAFRQQPRYLEVGDETIPITQRRLEPGMPAAERATRFGADLENPILDPIFKFEHMAREAKAGNLTDFQKEGGWGDIDILRQTADILREWRQRGVRVVPPHVYDVALDASKEVGAKNQLLDLDAPIKGQGDAVKDAIRQHYKEYTSRELTSQWTDTAKMDAMDWIQRHPGVSSRGWPEALKANGIVGAHYLDAQSRELPRVMKEITMYERQRDQKLARGEDTSSVDSILEHWRARAAAPQTSNYVMFPGTEHLIDILRRYGIAAPTAAATLSHGQEEPQQ